MASGAVRGLIPIVPIAIMDRNGALQQFQAVLDTGFAGAISLPRSSIERLGLINLRQEPVTLANGETQVSSIYRATAVWDGELYSISLYELGPEPLIGMGLLIGSRLTMDVYQDGPISIEPL